MVPTVQGLVPKGAWAPYARAIREVVTVPVITSNRINTVAVADTVIGAGDADYVYLWHRPFLADPQLVARSRDERPVNVCIACSWCIERAIGDDRVSCVVKSRSRA